MHITIRPKDKLQHKNKLLQKAKDLSFTSSNCISMQIKNQMESRPRNYHEQTQKKKYIINRIVGNPNMQIHKTIRK